MTVYMKKKEIQTINNPAKMILGMICALQPYDFPFFWLSTIHASGFHSEINIILVK